MAKVKFYAVKKGINPGIYKSWEECQANTKGFSGALFKSFLTLEEAEQYMVEDTEKTNDNIIENDSDEVDYDVLVSDYLSNNYLVAFTDGGYSGKSEIAGYGVYILEPNGLAPVEICDIVRTDKFKTSNNITPEIMAVTSAFDWAISNGYDKIAIFHDLEGIGKWAKKEWNAKADIVKWFVSKLEDTYNDLLEINYEWVKGHAGIQYNEEADRLATEAINKNTKPQFKMSETYFSCQNVGERDVAKIFETIKKDQKIKIKEEKKEGITSYTLNYNNEKLNVSFYRKKTRTLVQGKPNSLFSLFISYYTEKISDFDLVAAYAKMHKKTIKLKDIDEYTKGMNLPADFPIDAIKFIKQSLSEKTAISNKFDSEYDYSHFIFPAFRALEGTLKYLFEKSGTHIQEKTIIGGLFDKNDSDIYVLKGSKYNNSIYKSKIELLYNVYNRYRNSLGHFGELLNNDECGSTTMMVETSEEAINIIDDIMNNIRFD